MSKFILIILFAFTSCQLFSQDIVGGILSSNQIGSTQIEIIAVLYVDGTGPERPNLLLNGGQVSLSLTDSFSITDELEGLRYEGQVLHPSANGEYQYEAEVENWIGGIENIESSITEPLVLSHTTRIMQIYPLNSMPINESHPNGIVSNEGTYYYQPDFTFENVQEYLEYSLVESDNEGFYIPDGVNINPETGLISFTPENPGKYLVTVKAEKYLIDFDNPDIPRGNTELSVIFDVDPSTSAGKEIGSYQDDGVIVYPQPTEGHVNVVFNEDFKGPVDYIIYDLSGNLIQKGQLRSENDNLAVSGLASGKYIVFFRGNGLNESSKLLIERN